MNDQASELRSLVSATATPWAEPNLSPPYMAVLVGAKAGVGTTTLSVNMSIALAQLGHRVVLVDAHLGRSDVAEMCRMRERYGIFDLLAARRDIHEILEPGPLGIQVLPGTWGPEDPAEISQFSKQRLVSRLLTLSPHADWVVVDAGSQSGTLLADLCKAARTVCVVTSPETISVMDAYATIKSLVQGSFVPSLRLVVNQATSQHVSDDVNTRLTKSCERFLRVPLGTGFTVPWDEQIISAAEVGGLLMTKSPTSPAARAVEKLVTSLVANFETGQKGVAVARSFDSKQRSARFSKKNDRHDTWKKIKKNV